jgi:hypothetical protein
MRSIYLNILLPLIAVLLFASSAVTSHAELVGPVYPGAVIDKHYCEMKGDLNCPEAYYTKDTIEKVVAFYKSKGINLDKSRIDFPTYFSSTANPALTAVIHGYRDVARIRNMGNKRVEKAAVISAEYISKKPSGCKKQPFSDANSYIASLDLMAAMKGKPLSASEKKESQVKLDTLCKKYKDLQWSLYPYSDKTENSGKYIRYNRVKLSKDQSSTQQTVYAQMSKVDPERQIKRLKKKIKRNARKGRTAKVAALTAELAAVEAAQASSGAKKDTASTISDAQWEDIVSTIEMLDKNAYQTVIYIDSHPSTWKLKYPK